MTPNEIRNLINKKLLGQGSMIDVGGVLPAVLLNLLDLIEEGGGGGTADAVQYIPQELTESQQMQARKNQGLYYKEGETVSSLVWDGVPSEDDIHVHNEEFGIDYHLHRASSVPIPPSKMLGATVSWMGDTTEHSATITQAVVDTYESQAAQGYYNDPSAGFTVVLDDSMEEPAMGITVSRGVWFLSAVADGLSVFTKSIVLAEPYTEETIHHIEPKYIKDMYYEEEEIKTVTNPETNTWPYPSDASIDYQYKTYSRVSNDTPTKDDIISLIYKSDGTAQSPVRYDFVFNVAATNARPAYTVYRYTISAGNIVNFLVVSETQVVDGYTYNKGIYLPSELSGAYVYQVNYKATTIHQIPAKYIPSTGLDVFEIKVSKDILYGEPLEVENVTYQDIMDACSAGKYIVLTIMADDDIGVQGRCLGGNFSRMENTGGSIYGQPCYCFAGAYRQHSSGSSGQFEGYSLKDVVLYEDANDGLLYVELQNCNYNG